MKLKILLISTLFISCDSIFENSALNKSEVLITNQQEIIKRQQEVILNLNNAIRSHINECDSIINIERVYSVLEYENIMLNEIIDNDGYVTSKVIDSIKSSFINRNPELKKYFKK